MDKRPPAISIFATYDLYLASAISYLCDVIPTLKIASVVPKGLVSFSFPQSERLFETARDYAKKRLVINALSFSNRIKQIRGDMLMQRSMAKTIPDEVLREKEEAGHKD